MKIPFFKAAAIALIVIGSFVGATAAIPQDAARPSGKDGETKIAGTWRGDSLCVEKGTACHDEKSVYRIARIPNKRGYFMVTGGKVVGGKEIVMGSSQGRYDKLKHTLTIELERGLITLYLDGDSLEGTFTEPDNTVLRRITLKKSP